MSTTNPQSEATPDEGGSAAGDPARRARARRRSKHRRRLANVAGLMAGAGADRRPVLGVRAGAGGRRRRRSPPPRRPAGSCTSSSCITCHGANLEGVAGRGPSLIGVGEAAVYFQVHTGRMPLVRQEADAHDEADDLLRRGDRPADGLRAGQRRRPDPPLRRPARRRPGRGRRAVPAQLRVLPQLRRRGRRAELGQGRAEPAERHRPRDLHGDADRPGEHAGVR